MKRIIIISVLLAAAFVFYSCKRNEGASQISSVTPAATGSTEAAGPARTGTDGYVLRVNAAFYTLANDTGSESDRTTWAAAMTLGERVSILEQRRLTFGGDGAVYNFTKIRRDNGAEGFAWAIHIAEAGALAVVVDERANLFTSPRSVDVTCQTLPRRIVLVISPETEREGFVEMVAYDPVPQVIRRSFIRTGSISRRNSDIQASILMQTAEPLRNEGAEKVRKDALLEAALLDFPDSVFHADIQALVNPNAAAVINTERVNNPYMYATNDNVNVRDFPDTVVGRVVGSLHFDDEVLVVERTTTDSTIGGQSARWYRISEPFEGWVFGAFLE